MKLLYYGYCVIRTKNSLYCNLPVPDLIFIYDETKNNAELINHTIEIT